MKTDLNKFASAIKNFDWSAEQLATNLSAIGHEAEAINDIVEISLTANRKDCLDFNYLVFDLCALYPELEPVNRILYSHGPPVIVSIERINRLLGTDLKTNDLTKLERLGFMVDLKQSLIRVPDFRTGIETNADVAEELLRVIGFEDIPVSKLDSKSLVESARYQKLLSTKQLLVEKGLFETVTYSFSASGEVELKNPHSSEEPFLRTSLLEGLLITAAKNPYLKKLACFEIGSVFNPEEQLIVAVLFTGLKDPDVISKELTEILGTRVELNIVDQAQLNNHDVKQNKTYFFETDLDSISTKSTSSGKKYQLAAFKPISKYPPLTRDITLPISKTDAQKEINKVSNEFKEFLFGEIIDSYENPETKKVSTTIRLFFQMMDKSFSEEEISSIDTKLSDFLKTD